MTTQVVTLLARAEMTLLNSDRELLIFCASFNLAPDEPDSESLSEPARSIKFSEAA